MSKERLVGHYGYLKPPEPSVPVSELWQLVERWMERYDAWQHQHGDTRGIYLECADDLGALIQRQGAKG